MKKERVVGNKLKAKTQLKWLKESNRNEKKEFKINIKIINWNLMKELEMISNKIRKIK
jgi:hypothetical protein